MTEIRLNTCVNRDGREVLGHIRIEEDSLIVQTEDGEFLSVDRYVLDELLKRERHEGK